MQVKKKRNFRLTSSAEEAAQLEEKIRQCQLITEEDYEDLPDDERAKCDELLQHKRKQRRISSTQKTAHDQV